jgi:hypothetical protein
MQFRQAQPKRATCGAWKSSRERVVAARLRGCRERDAGGLVVEVETNSERGVVSCVRVARGAQGPPAGGAGTPGLLRTTDDAGVA